MELTPERLEQEQRVNIDDIYSKGDHLKAADLPSDVTVTIDSYEVVDFDDGKKVILRFRGKDKDLILNRINSSMIKEMHGSNVDAWIGKPITIGPDRTQFNGQMVPCIRVRFTPPAPPTQRAPQQAEPAGDMEDDIPF